MRRLTGELEEFKKKSAITESANHLSITVSSSDIEHKSISFDLQKK